MNGIKYILDTNFILGILKSAPVVLADIITRQIRTAECGYSAITRMELLGFPEITREEEAIIKQKLARLIYVPLTRSIEDVVADASTQISTGHVMRCLTLDSVLREQGGRVSFKLSFAACSVCLGNYCLKAAKVPGMISPY